MKQAIRVLAIVSILVLSLTACGFGVKPSTATLLPGQTPIVVLSTAAPGDPCLNEYFPVRSNATWNYASTGSPSGAYGFSKTITENRPDQFTIKVRGAGERPFQEDWQCGPEGFVAQSMTLTDTTSLLALRRFSEMQITNVSGVNIPAAITTGMVWMCSFDIQGVQKGADKSVIASMTGRVVISYTANGKENITVPAGNFEAMSITVETLTEITTIEASGPNTISASSAYTVWYAPGVGWVKSSGNGKLGTSEYFETIELQSFSIP